MNAYPLNQPYTLPFRIGTTSYIVPDNLLVNARFLADKVQDMQLVLFDVPGGPNNLPDAQTVAALAKLADEYTFTYTVHLLSDLSWGNGNHPSLAQARQVIELTQALKPWAYVLHLDGKTVRAPDTLPASWQNWQDDSVRALESVAIWAGDPALLVVENLEGYPPDFVQPVVQRTPVSRCVDVGHLWLDGIDPVPYLRAALPRTRVIHIHGLAARDHESLAHMSPAQLDPVIDVLLKELYTGVLTLEVFGEQDFNSSRAALAASIQRCHAAAPTQQRSA
ncbi:cobamide remodeling phosphodiesterase CbiR [soil metagenome]